MLNIKFKAEQQQQQQQQLDNGKKRTELRNERKREKEKKSSNLAHIVHTREWLIKLLIHKAEVRANGSLIIFNLQLNYIINQL